MENMMISSCKNPKLSPSQIENVLLHAVKYTGFHHIWQFMYLISKTAQIWKDLLMDVDLPPIKKVENIWHVWYCKELPAAIGEVSDAHQFRKCICF